jgi:hypothetical protein
VKKFLLILVFAAGEALAQFIPGLPVSAPSARAARRRRRKR